MAEKKKQLADTKDKKMRIIKTFLTILVATTLIWFLYFIRNCSMIKDIYDFFDRAVVSTLVIPATIFIVFYINKEKK